MTQQIERIGGHVEASFKAIEKRITEQVTTLDAALAETGKHLDAVDTITATVIKGNAVLSGVLARLTNNPPADQKTSE